MPSVEIYGSGYAALISYNVSQNVAANYSVVRVNRVQMRSLTSMNRNCYITGSIYVNGVQSTVLELTGTTSCAVVMSQNYYGGGEGDSWFSGFRTGDVGVSHNADGTAQISVWANLSVIYQSSNIGGINNTVYAALPRIPRVSELKAEPVELGQEMSIQLQRASSDFRDTVVWSCGARSGTLAEQTGDTALTWTVPLELADQVPEGTAAPVVLTLTTFSGSSQIGSRSVTVSCPLPESLVPTLTIAVEDKLGYKDVYGGFIQSQSQARVLTQAAGVYGSSIREIAVRCGRLSGTGEQAVFALEESGNVAITVTVTDSRGRSASTETGITVLPYRKPSVTIREAFRCDKSGNNQPDGDWLKVVFDSTVTALEGNSAAYRGLCTVHGGSGTRELSLGDYAGQFTVTGGSFLLSAGLDTAYDCRVAVQDSFSTVESSPSLVSVAFALLDVCRGTKAVGIGMRAKNAGKLSIGMDTDMNERSIQNMADPTQKQDAVTKGYADLAAYPVGAVYLSFADASPASLFGGTWERLKGRFLLGADEINPAGNIGGVAEVALTVDEMPSHNHKEYLRFQSGSDASMYAYYSYYNYSGYEAYSGITSSTGGGKAHNNMPPYLAVYMWKRVA